jgi:hypothetical protein
MNNVVMKGKDALAAALAECFVTIKGNRYNFMQLYKMEVNFKKTKEKIAILGKTGKGNKSTSWEGTGKGTAHYNQSIMRELLLQYKDTGEDIYFDVQITNDDPTSAAGRQTIILMDCNLDGGILAKYDASGGTIDEEIEFTYEDFKMPEKFKVLLGMI